MAGRQLMPLESALAEPRSGGAGEPSAAPARSRGAASPMRSFAS
jgi:hypothetical protein